MITETFMLDIQISSLAKKLALEKLVAAIATEVLAQVGAREHRVSLKRFR